MKYLLQSGIISRFPCNGEVSIKGYDQEIHHTCVAVFTGWQVATHKLMDI